MSLPLKSNKDGDFGFGPYVIIDKENSIIQFKLQDGPIGEYGINGCQIDTMIDVATQIIAHFNQTFPCIENNTALIKLTEALMWLNKRKQDRINRGVEGTSKL